MKKIIIAIDGYSACGKSTLARQLAEKLHYLFLDTGALYRAVALYMLQNKIAWNDPGQTEKALQDIQIEFVHDQKKNRHQTFLNGRNVEENIRRMDISHIVSEVAAVRAIRKFLVKQQQMIGERKAIVMDGRDIGTVVFPGAELKIFVTANLDVRIERRYLELMESGIFASKDDIRKNLLKRDHEETTRSDSPLRKADDAIELDNSNMTQEQQLHFAYQRAIQKISAQEN